MLGYLALATVAVAAIVLAIYLAPLVVGAAGALLVELGAVTPSTSSRSNPLY